MTFKTDQEKFWAGGFGDEYSGRNSDGKYLISNIALFARILQGTGQINSVIEFGANIGMNLLAIRNLLPEVDVSAIEINSKAIRALDSMERINVYGQSILDFVPDYPRDLVLIKGVLIHINPDSLTTVYDLLYKTSSRYICLAEYYSPNPVGVDYRGHSDRLFKRDFAGEMLDRFQNLTLVDYGFVYHRDKHFPQDDINWFLMEKNTFGNQ